MATTSKALNDLYWCLESPSLLADHFQEFSVINSLDADFLLDSFPLQQIEKSLSEHLAEGKSHFLGPYFERLWQFYLQHHPDYKLIASNLQIHEHGKTVGEFDFIVYNEVYQQYIHQEAAIKFYLGYPSGHKNLWIGPQTVDRLDKKMDRLLTHQLLLSEQPMAKKALNDMGIEHLDRQLLMRGYLFQPAHLAPLSLPDYVNPNCLLGSWMPLSEFKKRLNEGVYEGDSWKALTKLEWLTPYCTTDQDEIEKDPLQSDIDFSRPVLLSRLKPEAHLYLEEEKLFIVADQWPHLAKASPTL